MFLYDVLITHTRHRPPKYSFQHRLYTWLIDLDEPPRLPRPLRALARFDSRDHFGDPELSIRANVDRFLTAHGIDPRGGRVWMLAHPRMFGYVFNPITVYWCFRPDRSLECVIAEVHNTYGQRHRYLVRPQCTPEGTVDKRLYVSPFLPGEGRYHLSLPVPDEHLRLHIDLKADGYTLLTAGMTGRGRPVTAMRLLRAALRRPLVPHRVAALIRRHGIALWLRGAPRTPREHVRAGGTG